MTSKFKKVTEPWVGKEDLWQHEDIPSRFSTDGGVTYYDLDEELGPDGSPLIWSGDVPADLEQAVFQAVGAASSCWENLAGAGIFESDRAKDIGDELVAWIENNYEKKKEVTRG